jgi:hypothetical protein
MSKVVPVVLGLSVLGGCVYFAAQASVPASLRVEQQAQATIQKIQLTPEQAVSPQSPQASPDEQVSGDKPEQLVVQRNAYLDSTIAALKTQNDKLVCARAAFFQQLAMQRQTELGVAPEQYLIDLLAAKNQELLTTATQTGGFNGTAELQATGRFLTLDALAIAQALQNNYQGQSPTCISEPFQAGENAQNYLIRAQQYRAKVRAETDSVTTGEPANVGK